MLRLIALIRLIEVVMKDDCREVKAPQERFQSALRYVVEEPEQRPQSALCDLLGVTSKRSESHQSALRSNLGAKRTF